MGLRRLCLSAFVLRRPVATSLRVLGGGALCPRRFAVARKVSGPPSLLAQTSSSGAAKKTALKKAPKPHSRRKNRPRRARSTARTTAARAAALGLPASSSSSSKRDGLLQRTALLTEAFGRAGATLAPSSKAEWQRLRRAKPGVVAVDAEGLQYSPPLLVQVAYDDARGKVRVVVELPAGSPDAEELPPPATTTTTTEVVGVHASPQPKRVRLSRELRALLADDAVRKVFFGPPERERLGAPLANCTDLVKLVQRRWRLKLMPSLDAALSGAVGAHLTKRKRLSKVWGFRRRDGSWRRADFEEDDAVRHAAADAWATLVLWKQLRSASSSASSSPNKWFRRRNGQPAERVPETLLKYRGDPPKPPPPRGTPEEATTSTVVAIDHGVAATTTTSSSSATTDDVEVAGGLTSGALAVEAAAGPPLVRE